jgi:hypothetical protein
VDRGGFKTRGGKFVVVVVVVVTTVVRVVGAKENWPSELLEVDTLALGSRISSKSRFRVCLTVVVREG